MIEDYSGSDSTKDRLKFSYLKLSIEHGSQNVFPSLIATDACFSRRTFYRYYNDVAAIRAEAMEDALPREICINTYKNKEYVVLEQVSNDIVSFFEERPYAVQVFLGHNVDALYEHEVSILLKTLFRGLIERSFVLEPGELNCFVEYITSARLALIRLWARKGRGVTLSRMNMLADNIMEQQFWTQIAKAKQPEGQKTKFSRESLSRYPWLNED